VTFQRLSREAKLRYIEDAYEQLGEAATCAGITMRALSLALQPGWLEDDPPTWDWEHDPEYLSLRQRDLAARWRSSWRVFVNNPETRWARFLNTGCWEARA
jgi:hypothetical protein